MAKIVGEEWISLIITMIVLIVMQYPNGFIAISATASLFFSTYLSVCVCFVATRKAIHFEQTTLISFFFFLFNASFLCFFAWQSSKENETQEEKNEAEVPSIESEGATTFKCTSTIRRVQTHV